MQVFTLVVLSAHPAQITVLTKNVTVQGREDCLHQNGPQVIPVLMGSGGQVQFIACPHLCSPLCGTHLRREFSITYAASAVAATAVAYSGTAVR